MIKTVSAYCITNLFFVIYNSRTRWTLNMTISAKISRQVGTQSRSSEISSHPHSDTAWIVTWWNNRQNYYILKDFLDFYFWFHRTFILLIRKCFMNIISLRLFIFLIHNRGTLIFFQIRASQAKSLTALSEQHCPASPLEQFSSEVVSAINTLLFPTLPDKKFPRLSLWTKVVSKLYEMTC